MPRTVAPLQIGPLEVWPPLVLAPMSGVTNRTMRALYKPFGLGLTVTEFVSSNALKFGSKRTLEMIDRHPTERPGLDAVVGRRPGDDGNAAQARARMRRGRRRYQLRLSGSEGHQDERRVGMPARSAALRRDHARRRRGRRLPRHDEDADGLERNRSGLRRRREARAGGGYRGGDAARAYGQAILQRQRRLGAHRAAQESHRHPGDRQRRSGRRARCHASACATPASTRSCSAARRSATRGSSRRSPT